MNEGFTCPVCKKQNARGQEKCAYCGLPALTFADKKAYQQYVDQYKEQHPEACGGIGSPYIASVGGPSSRFTGRIGQNGHFTDFPPIPHPQTVPQPTLQPISQPIAQPAPTPQPAPQPGAGSPRPGGAKTAPQTQPDPPPAGRPEPEKEPEPAGDGRAAASRVYERGLEALLKKDFASACAELAAAWRGGEARAADELERALSGYLTDLFRAGDHMMIQFKKLEWQGYGLPLSARVKSLFRLGDLLYDDSFLSENRYLCVAELVEQADKLFPSDEDTKVFREKCASIARSVAAYREAVAAFGMVEGRADSATVKRLDDAALQLRTASALLPTGTAALNGYVAHCLRCAADAAAQAGDDEGARERFTQAIGYFAKSGLPQHAKEYQIGRCKYRMGDYAEALRHFESAVCAGDTEYAAYYAGKICFYGRDLAPGSEVERDMAKAKRYLTQFTVRANERNDMVVSRVDEACDMLDRIAR